MIKLIVARNKQNIIGVGNKLAWHITEELMHFKRETVNQTVVMGRKTWESIPEKFRPLPNRHNVVLSRSGHVEGAHETFSDIESLLAKHLDFIVMGGKEIYTMFLREEGLVDEIILSTVDAEVEDSEDNVLLDDLPFENFKIDKVVKHDLFEVSYLKKV